MYRIYIFYRLNQMEAQPSKGIEDKSAGPFPPGEILTYFIVLYNGEVIKM